MTYRQLTADPAVPLPLQDHGDMVLGMLTRVRDVRTEQVSIDTEGIRTVALIGHLDGRRVRVEVEIGPRGKEWNPWA